MAARPEFHQQLQAQYDQGKFVCVGLDADWNRLPPHIARVLKDDGATNFNVRIEATFKFLKDTVDATADLVLAYKPNIAFFEDSHRTELALQKIADYIHAAYPHIPVIGDVKRADIGATNKGYARAMFERYNFDAITTNPYFGHDTYPPFTEFEGRGLLVLTKTSNPQAHFYQDAPIDLPTYHLIQERNNTPLTDEEYTDLLAIAEDFESEYEEVVSQDPPELLPLYLIVARRTATLAEKNPNIGLVVGATHPEAFGPVRQMAPKVPILVPGIGTQGGDLEKTLLHAPDSDGRNIIINSASGIIFASSGEDYAEKAREKTLNLDTQIRQLMAARS